MSDSESQSESVNEPMAPFDPVLSNMLLKNLFTYFDQRGWVVFVVKYADGTEAPFAMPEPNQSNLSPEITIVRGLYSLNSIQQAGHAYLVEFLAAVSMLLIDHLSDYERV